jgi:hypothetical protein
MKPGQPRGRADVDYAAIRGLQQQLKTAKGDAAVKLAVELQQLKRQSRS